MNPEDIQDDELNETTHDNEQDEQEQGEGGQSAPLHNDEQAVGALFDSLGSARTPQQEQAPAQQGYEEDPYEYGYQQPAIDPAQIQSMVGSLVQQEMAKFQLQQKAASEIGNALADQFGIKDQSGKISMFLSENPELIQAAMQGNSLARQIIQDRCSVLRYESTVANLGAVNQQVPNVQNSATSGARTSKEEAFFKRLDESFKEKMGGK